jgi:chromatin assembly factor 1 subunit A
LSIDPFTFVSVPIADLLASKTQSLEINSGFAVPQLPSRLSHPSSTPVQPASGAALVHSNGTITAPKRAAPPPKTSFPDAHMPFLIAKVKELDTGNMTFITESIHKDLNKQLKAAGAPTVKKNAIEAKLKDVSEKDNKIWVVKADVKVSDLLMA